MVVSALMVPPVAVVRRRCRLLVEHDTPYGYSAGLRFVSALRSSLNDRGGWQFLPVLPSRSSPSGR